MIDAPWVIPAAIALAVAVIVVVQKLTPVGDVWYDEEAGEYSVGVSNRIGAGEPKRWRGDGDGDGA